MAYELQDFSTDVIEASNSVPVVIDFWAEWCGPCRQLGPVLEKLAGEAEGHWKLVKVDTEKSPDLAVQFSVRGIPAVKMVYQSEIIAEFTGAQPEHLVRQWLEENLPEGKADEVEEVSSHVRKLLGEGNRKQATSVLASQIKENASPDLQVQYAMLLLPGNIKKAEQHLKKVDRAEKYEIEFEALETIKRLKQIKEEKIKPGSNNEQARQTYVKGAQALFEQNFEEALQNFIEALQLERTLDDDGPRKACIACFTILFPYHPLAIKYRRQFSMSLY